jgi:DNA gyrase/topoisomerase IV subunit B
MSKLKSANKANNQSDVIQFTDLEHARKRAEMYMGGLKSVKCQLYKIISAKGFQDLLCQYKEEFSPAASKLIDEILSNAVDQFTETGTANIFLWFDKKTGECIVRNDGSCVPLTMSKDMNGKDVPTPELCFGYFRSSSNFYKEEGKKAGSNKDIVGGMNGLGATLTNAFCKKFEVEIFDATQELQYNQTWHNCMMIKDDPIETTVKTPKSKRTKSNSYTQIKFMLNWEDFGLNPKTDSITFTSLEHWIRFRLLQTNVYVSSNVTYNDSKITSFDNIGQMIESVTKYHLMSKANETNGYSNYMTVHNFALTPKGNYPWEISVGIKPSGDASGFEHITIVNGLWVMNGGLHIDHIMHQLRDYICPLMEKMYTSGKKITLTHLKPYIILGINCQISDPKFSGQRKDKLSSPPEKYYKKYVIDEKDLKKIWDNLKPFIKHQLEEQLFIDIKDEQKANASNAGNCKNIKKYHPAEGAHRAKSGSNKSMRGLIISEGDSANGMIDKGLRDEKIPDVTYDNFGTFNIQGVPMNARRQVEHKTNNITGETLLIRKDKLKKNERLSSLVRVLGLEYGKEYTASEMMNLNYQYIVIATDQDHHGKGKIKTELIDFIVIFWPGLIKMGFVKFLITPAVRCIHKKGTKPVEEFYSDHEYDEWEGTQGRTMKQLEAEWEIVYYKGLGSHDPDERRSIFRNWDINVITIRLDKNATVNLRAFLGENSEPRKKVLSTPVVATEQDYYKENIDGNLGFNVDGDRYTLTVTVTAHTWTDTKGYQLYDVSTRIPRFEDGFITTRRKIFAAARAMFGQRNHNRTKIPELVGDIFKNMKYHHGDTTLAEVVLKQAQDYVGSLYFPFLKAMCDVGSRHFGGTDKVAPRYGYVKLNTKLCNLMYSPTDDWALQYMTSEGKQVEPVTFVPIMPMAILENNKMPSHGWANTTWARDYDEVLWYLLKCIDGGVSPDPDPEKEGVLVNGIPTSHKVKFPTFDPNRFKIDPNGKNPTDDFAVSVFGYTNPKLETIGKEKVLNSFGSYRWTGPRSFQITELPIRTWNEHFIEGNPTVKTSTGIKQNPIIEDIVDRSTNTEIIIDVTLVPDWAPDMKKKEDKEWVKTNKGATMISAKNYILRKYDNSKTLKDLDPVIRFFDMKQTLKSNLTFLIEDGTPYVFESYMDLFKRWYFTRQQCYVDRITRQIVILELKILKIKNTIRYAENRKTYKLEGISENDQDDVMKKAKFDKINNTVLNNPSYLRPDEIKNQVMNLDVSFNYLLNMNARQITDKRIIEYKKDQEKMENELLDLQPDGEAFKGQHIWRRELKALDVVVQAARSSENGWTYDEPPKFWKESRKDLSEKDAAKGKKKGKGKAKK